MERFKKSDVALGIFLAVLACVSAVAPFGADQKVQTGDFISAWKKACTRVGIQLEEGFHQFLEHTSEEERLDKFETLLTFVTEFDFGTTIEEEHTFYKKTCSSMSLKSLEPEVQPDLQSEEQPEVTEPHEIHEPTSTAEATELQTISAGTTNSSNTTTLGDDDNSSIEACKRVGIQLEEGFHQFLEHFILIHIFPKDYKRVLMEGKAEKEKEEEDNDWYIAGFEMEEDFQEAEFEESKSDDGAMSSTSSDDESGSGGSTGEGVVRFHAKKGTPDIENLSVPAYLQRKDDEPLDKLRGFVKYNRQKKIYRNPEERLKDWDEVYDFEAIRSNIRQQAARCMDCGVTFCQGNTGCPLGNIIPKWNDYVFKKNWRQALEQMLQTNNFPAPCEGACCLAIGSPAVTIKSIECAIIDYAFLKSWILPQKPAESTGKRIAIIESGPAGLACASQLIKVGHTVVVYERKNRVGGLLRYGIPTMKLYKYVVDRRVKLLEAEGVRFLVNTDIGKDVPADFLLKDNDAIVVCTGSTTARDLQVEGRDSKGICYAMEFLEKSQKRRAGDNEPWEGLDPKDKKVIILGGGDTATDCIVTANRLGAKTVIAFEILPQPTDERKADNPWPEWPLIFRTDYGHEEAKAKTGQDPRTYSISTKRFLMSTNAAGVKVLTGLETVEVRWEKDEKGAWKLIEVEGTIKTYEADLCILAMGFVGPEKKVIEQLTLKTDPRSNIMTANEKYDSSVAKVFAAGDCRRGQSLVVWAVHEGRQAARQEDEYLMGATTLAGPGLIVLGSYNLH